MEKYSLVAIAATAITLLLCLLAVFTRSAFCDQPTSGAAQLQGILIRPFASQVIIPAVCTVLVALALTRKISLWICGLLTLVNLCAFGSCLSVIGGNFFHFSAWFFNMQDLILRISPIWFAAIAVLGVVEKRTIVCAMSAVGLALIGFLQTAVISVLSNTPAATNWFNIVTGGSVVLIAALTIYDWATTKKKNQGA